MPYVTLFVKSLSYTQPLSRILVSFIKHKCVAVYPRKFFFLGVLLVSSSDLGEPSFSTTISMIHECSITLIFQLLYLVGFPPSVAFLVVRHFFV